MDVAGSFAVRARRLAPLLMIVSGAAGLGYQIVWTQQSSLWLGHEAAAILAVVTAFFGGLAVGSLWLGARIEASAHPECWYAACEAAIGLWGLALVFLLPPISSVLVVTIGMDASALRHWSIAFLGTFLLLLPATAAMGATLPAMERMVASLRAAGSPIAALYAANTFGAVLGVMGAAFVLVPRFGLTATALICVAASFTCALSAQRLFAVSPSAPSAPSAPSERKPTPDSHRTLATLALTGLLGIGYEVLVVRVLSQVAENTVYTFALLLTVYLVGTAAGAAALARFSGTPSERLRDALLRALALACLAGSVALAFANRVKAALLETLGAGFGTALASEAILAAAAFLVPTILMGALFSLLATRARLAGTGFGRALGVNTTGAAFAPLVFGLLLLAGVGATHALAGIAACYLLLASRAAWRAPSQLASAAATAAFVAWSPSLAHVDLPSGGRLVSLAEGALATVTVIEDADGVATLHINNRQQEGSNATWLTDARQGVMPILLHPAPRRALFLGLGTGVTSRAANDDATLEVDAVELLPEVIEASNYFAPESSDPRALRVPTPRHPAVRTIAADARRFVRTAAVRYDVIVSDNFHPARNGSGALYTVEHFTAVRERLATGGVFCQWLPLHQLDLDSLRSIVRSYLAAFPSGAALLATNSLETPVVGLVSRRDGERFDSVTFAARRAALETTRPLADYGLADDIALYGSFIAGPGSLARFSEGAPFNTDDRPFVTYSAPRITYAPQSAPRDRLLALLQVVDVEEALLDGGISATRLAAYRAARDRYLEVGRHVRPTADVRVMLGQVREPLLFVLHLSPDFRPAYDPLLSMARQLARSDAGAARALLVQLAEAQPARREAAEDLRALDTARP